MFIDLFIEVTAVWTTNSVWRDVLKFLNLSMKSMYYECKLIKVSACLFPKKRAIFIHIELAEVLFNEQCCF